MSNKKYDKGDLFASFIGKTTEPEAEEKSSKKSVQAPTKKQAAKQSKTDTQTEREDTSPRPVGRPPSIDEEVKKYSYYLTERHQKALKLCAIKLDTDYSSIVRDALEAYCRKNGTW